MKLTTKSGTALALAAAAMIGAAAVPGLQIAPAQAAETVKCFGINSCAGHGGNNSCAGKGVISTTKANCLAKGGKIVG
jgi:uncharacterized membrane protein